MKNILLVRIRGTSKTKMTISAVILPIFYIPNIPLSLFPNLYIFHFLQAYFFHFRRFSFLILGYLQYSLFEHRSYHLASDSRLFKFEVFLTKIRNPED